jgi:TonB family protein
MRTPTRLDWLAAATLLTVLVAPLAGAAAPSKPPGANATARDTLRSAGAAAPKGFTSVAQYPEPRSRMGVNLSSDALDSPGTYKLKLQLQLDANGMVDDVSVLVGDTPFDSAAVDAVRWWIFTPARAESGPVPMRVAVPIEITVPESADPISPDVLAFARDAEAQGDVQGALDAWTGVCARIGTHPLLADDYTPRMHAIRLAARLPKPPATPMMTVAKARGTYNLMLRNIARAANEDYAKALTEVLRDAPWYAEAYRWRASARAASGQRDHAMRDVRLFALASPDSASQALAARALRALAAGDTIAALTMLK